ncbi:MAG: hypothetical protein CMB82_08925 [Flammeovirgaceae bacterium]|nr:hypothetical protein [Flammeovirgaceae bacterium]
MDWVQGLNKSKIARLIDRLPNHYIRLHRSFIMNKKFMKLLHNEKIVLNLHDKALSISRSFKNKSREDHLGSSSLIIELIGSHGRLFYYYLGSPRFFLIN